MRELPGAGRLAAWGSAALRGAVSLDDAADAVAGGHDAAHRLAGLPGEEAPVSLAYGLGRLRALGATGLRLVLPRPGDAAGLPGPAAFTQAAVSCGAAVVAEGADLALLPAGRGMWQAYAVERDLRTPLSLRDAERGLAAVIRESAAVLATLDVARWDPAAAAVVGRPARHTSLPPTAAPHAHAVLAQALRVAGIVEIARDTEGGSVTTREMTARSDVLRDLDTAARRALEAACRPTPG